MVKSRSCEASLAGDGARRGTETAPSRRVTQNFERQRSRFKKVLIQNEEVEERSCSPMSSGAVSDGPGTSWGAEDQQLSTNQRCTTTLGQSWVPAGLEGKRRSRS